jgi:hypothetical protein
MKLCVDCKWHLELFEDRSACTFHFDRTTTCYLERKGGRIISFIFDTCGRHGRHWEAPKTLKDLLEDTGQ